MKLLFVFHGSGYVLSGAPAVGQRQQRGVADAVQDVRMELAHGFNPVST